MRWRRTQTTDGSAPAWQVEAGGQWRAATPEEAATRSWLPQPLAGSGLSFQPLSFRDCSLYEQHWVQSSRGYARRFLPLASAFTSLYERVTGRVFPAFKPHPLAYAQPVYYFGNQIGRAHV